MKLLHRVCRTLIVCVCLFTTLGTMAAAQPLDSVIAVVNKSVVTQSQLNDTITRLKSELRSSGKPIPASAELKKTALDQLIGQALQLQVAQRANIQVNDQQVTEAINRIAQQNKITVDQLKQELGKEGIACNRFRNQLKDQITLHQIQQQALGTKVRVTDSEVQAYINKQSNSDNAGTQYQLDDLLIPLSKSPSAANLQVAQKRAAALMKQAHTTTSFAALQKANSTLEYNNLGWRTQQELPAVFAKAVTGLKVNQIAGPLQAPNGLHIIQLRGKRTAKAQASLSFDQAKQELLQQKFQQAAAEWAKELRKTAYIKMM